MKKKGGSSLRHAQEREKEKSAIKKEPKELENEPRDDPEPVPADDSSERAPQDIENTDQDQEDITHAQSEDGDPEARDQLEEEEEKDVRDPRDFDGRRFLDSVTSLEQSLHSDSYRNIDDDFPVDELLSMVTSVTGTLQEYKDYATQSTTHLDSLRTQLRDIKDRMYKKVHSRPYDNKAATQRMTLEERELQSKVTQLNAELARVGEELIRASQITMETESASVQATLMAERAAEEARTIQAEYEARRLAELEARKAEEERKRAQREKQEAEARRKEEQRLVEEARRKRLHKPEQAKAPDWEKWPTYTYRVDAGEFDQGVGCVVRGESGRFQENMVTCDTVPLLESGFVYAENEELVGNVVQISGDFNSPIMVALPHCTSRASAMSREPVIKTEVEEGCWKELSSTEITLDGYKDLKFVQAEVKKPSKLAVITRLKRDFLHMSKRGGKITSSVDARVTFQAGSGTFKQKENFTLQLQPVDSGTLLDLRTKTKEGKGLLTSSAIVSMEWMSTDFRNPVTMTLPCPPNPVKAKKAAAARAAKEAKMKNPQPPPQMFSMEAEKPNKNKKKKVDLRAAQAQAMQEEESEKVIQKPTKWYMGQYGNNDDDENDSLFFIEKTSQSRWHVVDHVCITQVKLDLLQFPLHSPVEKFVILRTRTNVEAKEAEIMAETIELQLSLRVVKVIIKQRKDLPSELVLHVTPANKSEKVLQQLERNGFDDGPGASRDVTLREGDFLELSFRGNIQSVNDPTYELIFNSNIPTKQRLSVKEVDSFLQKSYSVYRGFVQVFRCYESTRKPTKTEIEEGITDLVVEQHKDLVQEMIINIPKPEQELEMMKPVNKAPIILRNRDSPVNNDTLRHLALELGEEWLRLAQILNVRRTRLQAILRQHHNTDNGEEGAKFDMLITWAKKMPRGMSKVETLSQALALCGRMDLAQEIRDLEDSFQQHKNELDYDRDYEPVTSNSPRPSAIDVEY